MTIHLSHEQERFVRSLLGEGRYTSEREVVEEALRLLERTQSGKAEQARRIDALLIEGLDSGPSTPMTAADWDEISREGERRIAARKAR